MGQEKIKITDLKSLWDTPLLHSASVMLTCHSSCLAYECMSSPENLRWTRAPKKRFKLQKEAQPYLGQMWYDSTKESSHSSD